MKLSLKIMSWINSKDHSVSLLNFGRSNAKNDLFVERPTKYVGRFSHLYFVFVDNNLCVGVVREKN